MIKDYFLNTLANIIIIFIDFLYLFMGDIVDYMMKMDKREYSKAFVIAIGLLLKILGLTFIFYLIFT